MYIMYLRIGNTWYSAVSLVWPWPCFQATAKCTPEGKGAPLGECMMRFDSVSPSRFRVVNIFSFSSDWLKTRLHLQIMCTKHFSQLWLISYVSAGYALLHSHWLKFIQTQGLLPTGNTTVVTRSLNLNLHKKGFLRRLEMCDSCFLNTIIVFKSLEA